ncbi:MAG TPA: ribose 5-phosphate isomerase A [Gammaproteobacteria bacterium]|nr:ribose 5-phosphate isomerase A [Gammaproteobacteria bacterium]HAU06611.1 ribose 5-phosphate isomerase A [Gammaproteobacteria bacterium]
MTADDRKKQAAYTALEHIPLEGVIGVGTGSTVNHFIDALATVKGKIEGAVSSSSVSTKRLEAHGISVYDLNDVGNIASYIDGADEANSYLQLVKGGGGALTREKIIAAASERFVCIVDDSKQVSHLGTFPLPVEVIPMARSYVAREIVKLGGQPVYREGFITDNHNVILDVHGLEILEPIAIEKTLNQIVGVVTNGLFAMRPADILLVGSQEGTKVVSAQ